MAAIANTFQTFQAKGIREDLSNIIYNIDPSETPFMTNAGRGTVKNTFAEWQTDGLAAPDTSNAQIEGDDVTTFGAVAPTVRIGNYTQISRKTLLIAGTEEVVDKAGRKSETSYQLAKLGKELRLDMESILLSNQAAAAGSSTTPRKLGSLLAFIHTNVSEDAGGTNAPALAAGAPTVTRVDSATTRAFTEALLKPVLQQGWTNGANFKMLMVGPANKVAASAFTGNATKTFYTDKVDDIAIIAASDVYVSDFGKLMIVPSRLQRARDAFLFDFGFVSVDYLRPFAQEPLAKTGDAEKRMMLVEYTLRVKNEKALGLIADLS